MRTRVVLDLVPDPAPWLIEASIVYSVSLPTWKSSMYTPHAVALDGIAIFDFADQGQTITSLTEICNHVCAHLEFGLIQGRITVCWSLNEPILTSVGGIG